MEWIIVYQYGYCFEASWKYSQLEPMSEGQGSGIILTRGQAELEYTMSREVLYSL